MVTRYVDVPRYRWGVLVMYDIDVSEDGEDLYAIMRSFGMKIRDVERSLRILATLNSGMALTQDDLRMSCIFIGRASEPSQFWNTLSHEIKHVTDAIVAYYDLPCDGEDAAMLDGYIMQECVEKLSEPCY